MPEPVKHRTILVSYVLCKTWGETRTRATPTEQQTTQARSNLRYMRNKTADQKWGSLTFFGSMPEVSIGRYSSFVDFDCDMASCCCCCLPIPASALLPLDPGTALLNLAAPPAAATTVLPPSTNKRGKLSVGTTKRGERQGKGVHSVDGKPSKIPAEDSAIVHWPSLVLSSSSRSLSSSHKRPGRPFFLGNLDPTPRRARTPRCRP